ncbi:hypothetical protein [Abyssalbus ytuae]|uniref:Uncharacterized protein n=1 Tax=Abyssalbus ytuae TaxID=2926907 RepID=A0A9E6ZT61_9FLAO|nr:hypothetical protein [Abyssalbus ytuae]UOB16231.1 hypothetical protein MQE35_10835 [Abyssalbus ytuae]
MRAPVFSGFSWPDKVILAGQPDKVILAGQPDKVILAGKRKTSDTLIPNTNF